MQRKFYAPLIVMAAIMVVGGIMQGQAAKKQADAEAEILDMQAEQERKQLRRDQDDLSKDQSRTEARQRALLAAGGGISDGSDLAVLTETSSQYARMNHRLTDDSTTRSTLLNTKASNTRKAGNDAQRSAIFGGVMKGASTMSGGGGSGGLFSMPKAG